MIAFIIVGIVVLGGILDTAFGNRMLPSKVGVVRIGGKYYVYKYQRYFFIPLKMWLQYQDNDRTMMNFSPFLSDARHLTEKFALETGKIYSNTADSSVIE
jgi:hypothetical protein